MNPWNEWIMIAVISAGAILCPAGGTHIPGSQGRKWLRREALPIIWAICLYLAGFEAWRAVLFAISMDAVFRLPYGTKTPYWLKAVVFSCYPIPSLLLGFTIWQLIAPIAIFSLFVLSNLKKTAKDFPWKIVESFMGFLIGIILATIISKSS